MIPSPSHPFLPTPPNDGMSAGHVTEYLYCKQSTCSSMVWGEILPPSSSPLSCASLFPIPFQILHTANYIWCPALRDCSPIPLWPLSSPPIYDHHHIFPFHHHQYAWWWYCVCMLTLDEIKTTIRQLRHVTSLSSFVHTIGPQYLHRVEP